MLSAHALGAEAPEHGTMRTEVRANCQRPSQIPYVGLTATTTAAHSYQPVSLRHVCQGLDHLAGDLRIDLGWNRLRAVREVCVLRREVRQRARLQ